MFFAGVSLLQDDPFDAVPERPKHEENQEQSEGCLLYTSDAADEL